MADTHVQTALSSITLDDVFDYIRKEERFGDSHDGLKGRLTSIDEETWRNDMRRYQTYVEELEKKLKEAGVEIDTVRDFNIEQRMSRIRR